MRFDVLFLIILKLCTNKSNAFNTSELRVICGMLYGTSVLDAPRSECTAIGVKEFDPDMWNAVSQVKGTLPLLVIDNSYDYLEWLPIIQLGASNYFEDLTQIGIKYYAFTRMQKIDYDNPIVDLLSESLEKFIKEAKELYPEVGFGIVLSNYLTFLSDCFDLKFLSELFDFVILDSSTFRLCEHNKHQEDMNILATKNDIIDTIHTLRDLGLQTEKLIYSIKLKVKSVKKEFMSSAEYEDFGYSHARIRIQENLLGIYVNDIEDDDINGDCGCKTHTDGDVFFRGLKTISGASQENVNNVSFYECSEGQFPVIRH